MPPTEEIGLLLGIMSLQERNIAVLLMAEYIKFAVSIVTGEARLVQVYLDTVMGLY